ncbi:hypothetical protein BDN70DRAFT_499068 [Pholiota conissans]|uniref:Uncharacterized protein n=1 Tax=Pholiota conissans TaxID=109636 RepID=A0A9P6CVK2_9AGAR|nr:hypothetical protein BDN70DRAFT_499068 [Pholiota conissans]
MQNLGMITKGVAAAFESLFSSGFLAFLPKKYSIRMADFTRTVSVSTKSHPFLYVWCHTSLVPASFILIAAHILGNVQSMEP